MGADGGYHFAMTQREREVWYVAWIGAWDALNPRWSATLCGPLPSMRSAALAWTAYALTSAHGRRRVA